MKTFTIYKTVLICLFLSLSTLLSAQCPYTANITIVDAGGCGNTSGKVFFTVAATNPSSIVGVYYLVYKADGTTLVTSSTNTNPEVSTLPAGEYFAEVKVQCTSGTQAPWRKAFTIKQSTNNDFSGTFYLPNSRLTTLNAFPSGQLTYNFTGGSTNYTLDIVNYPAAYTGPLHFENIPKGYFNVDKLAEGDYSVRMTNGCMVITDGPRTIKKTEIDMPTSASYPYAALTIINTQGNGIVSTRPTTDYKAIYFSMNGTITPEDFWNPKVISEFYEYAAVNAEEGEVINAQTVWKDMGSGYNRVDCKYSIGEMYMDRPKIPTVYIRLKGTNVTKNIKPYFSITHTAHDLRVAPSANSCGNADFYVGLRNRGILTYPLDIVIRSCPADIAVPVNELKRYTVTEADMKSASGIVQIPDVDISTGYSVVFIGTGDPHEFISKSERESLPGLVRMFGNRLYVASYYCQSDLAHVYLSTDLDLRGAKIKYVGDIPLADDIIKEFTIPTEAEGTAVPSTIYLTTNIGSKPWATSTNYAYTPMPPGTYKWEISIPCGGGYTTFTKEVLLAAPNKAVFDGSKYNPKMGSISACGEAYIELGDYADLKGIFSYNSNIISTASFALCTKLSGSGNPLGPYYNAIWGGTGIYYPGNNSQYCYTASTANASITQPKIRITKPGTYYLVAMPSTATTVFIMPEACYDVREFVVTQSDLNSSIDENKTGAYFCAQDKSSGIIFIHRKGEKVGGLKYTFKIWNATNSFDKTVETDELNVTFDNIDVATYGTKFFISVFTEGGCTSTEYSYEINLNEINNSATFVTQNKSSDCSGTIDLEIEATAHEYTSYKWKDVTGRQLSATNKVSGKFPAGTKLYLDVQFNATAPGGGVTPCGLWTKEYIVDGAFLVEYHWNSSATNSNWNTTANWRNKYGLAAGSLPGECAHVHIPSNVNNFYPDLNISAPTSKISHISFATGAQLYGQHLLDYSYVFVNYDFGYYSTLPSSAPTTIVQPNKSIYEKTGSSINTVPFANLPVLKRARWYNLASPLKGMYFSDFQLAGKPYVTEKILDKVTPSPTLLIKGNYFATADNFPLSDWNNTITVWVPPHNDAIGAEDQSVLQDLKGDISYPYFYPYILNDEIINVRPDISYDRVTRKMEVADIDMATLVLSNEETIVRHEKSGRFVYELDTTDKIASNGYQVNVSTNTSNGWVRVGNPFMAPLNFDEFIKDNASVIEARYLLESDGKTLEYKGAAGSNTVDKYIAPQQSFIVVLKNPSASGTITFKLGAIATQDAATRAVKIK